MCRECGRCPTDDADFVSQENAAASERESEIVRQPFRSACHSASSTYDSMQWNKAPTKGSRRRFRLSAGAAGVAVSSSNPPRSW
jgi:hypothetical protein